MHDLITKVIASQEMQEIATWVLIFVALYLSGRAILELIFQSPLCRSQRYRRYRSRPKTLSTGDVLIASLIAQERTRNERPRQQPICPDRRRK